MDPSGSIKLWTPTTTDAHVGNIIKEKAPGCQISPQLIKLSWLQCWFLLNGAHCYDLRGFKWPTIFNSKSHSWTSKTMILLHWNYQHPYVKLTIRNVRLYVRLYVRLSYQLTHTQVWFTQTCESRDEPFQLSLSLTCPQLSITRLLILSSFIT